MTAGFIGQARDLPLDAHLHTDLSPDSAVPVDVYAAAAADLGIAEIAITDHLDFDRRAPAFAYADFERRMRVVREAAGRWAGKVAIRFGVEITFERTSEDTIRRHLTSHAYDFVIGSVHAHLFSPYGPSHVASFAAGKTLAEAVEPYFAEVEAAARSGLFDTLGHLDYVKKYLIPHFRPADFAAAPELYEPVLRTLVESGMALEVNASGLRQPPRETYPPAPIVARFRELGGRDVTAGSDAHAAHDFAFGLAEAYRSISDAGYAHLAFRRGAGRLHVAIPRHAST